jgi:hypothetical protein
MSRRYRFGPLEQRSLIGGLRSGQVAVLAGAAVLGLLALYVIGGAAGVVVTLLMLLIGAAAIFLPVNGRTVDEWTPVIACWYWRRRKTGGRYRSSAPGLGMRVGEGGEQEHVPSLPPELEGLELLSIPYGSDHVGVMCDRREGTYTVALAVRAGAFALRDTAEQERALEAWGAVLAGCARDGSPVRRMQWIEQTVPGQGDDLASYMQEKRDRSVPLDSDIVRSYIELLESAAPVTQEHEVLLALQIDYGRGAKEIKRLGGGDEGACELVLREAEAMAQRLGTAEITVFGLLRPRQYAEVIRDAFDPFGRQARTRAALDDPEREGVDPDLMGPLADETSWSHYRTDSAFHCTYWVSSWPRSDVGPTFLAPLLMQGSSLRAVSVTIEPVPYSVAMRKAEMAQTAEVAEEMGRHRHGQMTTARTRRRQQASSRREEELADGHAELRIVGMVRAYNATPELFDRTKSEVEHGAQLARLELQPLWGEQEAGFANTLPLCRGLL